MNEFDVDTTPPVAPRRSRSRRRFVTIASGGVAAVVVGVGCLFGAQTAQSAQAGGTTSVTGSSSSSSGSSGGYGGAPSGGWQDSQGATGQGTAGQGTSGQGTGGSVTYTGQTAASTAQSSGIVIIETVVYYGQAEAAGTGMVLTSTGEILTNNHVIEGATSITVEVVSTGATYTASVVGTDAADDVAVLQLAGASGLTTATFDTSGILQVGDQVTGVGDAGGTGTLLTAAGDVTALNQTITTQAEAFAASETLDGLIETDAAIQAGDSGGPLYDADGEVIGMDTAASSGGAATGYAIPITTALSIAQAIASGQNGDGIVQGYPAFLGVQLAQTVGRFGGSTTSGAVVGGVLSGTPAATAGLTAGDVITAVDGTAVASAAQLSTALDGYAAGQSVTLTWTGTTGASHTATVTLVAGPAA